MRRQGGFPPCKRRARFCLRLSLGRPCWAVAPAYSPFAYLSRRYPSPLCRVLYSALPRCIAPARRRPGTTRATTALIDSRKSRNRRQWKRIAGNYRPDNRNAVAADAPRHHLLTLSASQTRATTLSLSEFTSVKDSPIYAIVLVILFGHSWCPTDRSDKVQICVRFDRVKR